MKLKENKRVSSFSQTQQYKFIFISFYLDNMFRLIDHHQAILYRTQNKDSEFCKDGLMMVHQPKYVVKTRENKDTHIVVFD